jgi:hypothetical protein
MFSVVTRSTSFPYSAKVKNSMPSTLIGLPQCYFMICGLTPSGKFSSN